jgi:hypothetical protein
MKLIPLTQGRVAIVDDEDYDLLSRFKWCYSVKDKAGNCGYALRRNPETGGVIYMHRQILNSEQGTITDHINCDRLDNRKENLRQCSQLENSRNRGRNSNNKSGYKGVYLHRPSNKWAAIIHHNRIGKYLGLFHTKEEAHAAYCRAAIEMHGEFARTK